MINDPVADMLTRIRNANGKYKEKVDIPASRLKEEILKIMKQEGFIASYKKIEDYKQGILRVYLKYGPNKEKVILGLRRVSRPGLRKYRPWNEMPNVFRGIGISIISTSRGLMTDSEAKKLKIGGEVICSLW